MATATQVRPPFAAESTSRHSQAAPSSAHPPWSSSPPSTYVLAAEVERDEAWVRQLQDEQNHRFNQQARLMHKELLVELERAGPFVDSQTREALQARYDERLEQMRAMQQEELDQHIEMERQERLWSLGLEDENWEGWNRVLQDQAAILANIRRASVTGADAGVQERIRENAREAEDVDIRSEEWQRTEAQRTLDRARWAERQRLTTTHIGERRQRDLAEAESLAAQAHAREAQLRETLASQSGSLPSSRLDSVFGSRSSSTDTPPSSVFDRPSPTDDLRRASPTRPSPLSGNSASYTMMYATGEEPARPTVWIPPEGTREPGRKKSTFFDGPEPTRKPSVLFDEREPTRRPSGSFDARGPTRKSSGMFDAHEPKLSAQFGSATQEDFSRRTSQTSSHSQSQSQQPPHAPSFRTAPLPTPQASYTSPQQQPQPQSQSIPRTTTQPRPTAPSTATSAFPQSRRQETRTPPKTVPPQTANNRSTPSPTTIFPTQAAPQTARQTPPTSARQNPVPPRPDLAEERRRQLREEYTRTEAQRVEEERRRRDEEANQKRAEEARRRGAEKRRAEEEAREAERKEAERRARAAGIKPAPVKAADIAEVWAAYESHWAAMASATQLRFRSIPWPVTTPVLEPAGLLPIQIAAFVLSPAHSQGKVRKDRLREALLRWHPDRFETKWLHKVVDEERELVKEGVGLVVRALNELLSAEGTFAA